MNRLVLAFADFFETNLQDRNFMLILFLVETLFGIHIFYSCN